MGSALLPATTTCLSLINCILRSCCVHTPKSARGKRRMLTFARADGGMYTDMIQMVGVGGEGVYHREYAYFQVGRNEEKNARDEQNHTQKRGGDMNKTRHNRPFFLSLSLASPPHHRQSTRRTSLDTSTRYGTNSGYLPERQRAEAAGLPSCRSSDGWRVCSRRHCTARRGSRSRDAAVRASPGGGCPRGPS